MCLQTGAMDQLKGLIETSVKDNEGMPAVLVAHSMGNLVALWLMYHQSPRWIEDNIGGFVCISAPLLGSITALKGATCSSDGLQTAQETAARQGLGSRPLSIGLAGQRCTSP